MGDHLVRDVFLLAEQFLQPDNRGQQEGQLADEQRFAHEQRERLERQHLEHGHFHHHGGHHRSHVLVFAATCNNHVRGQRPKPKGSRIPEKTDRKSTGPFITELVGNNNSGTNRFG